MAGRLQDRGVFRPIYRTQAPPLHVSEGNLKLLFPLGKYGVKVVLYPCQCRSFH